MAEWGSPTSDSLLIGDPLHQGYKLMLLLPLLILRRTEGLRIREHWWVSLPALPLHCIQTQLERSADYSPLPCSTVSLVIPNSLIPILHIPTAHFFHKVQEVLLWWCQETYHSLLSFEIQVKGTMHLMLNIGCAKMPYTGRGYISRNITSIDFMFASLTRFNFVCKQRLAIYPVCWQFS